MRRIVFLINPISGVSNKELLRNLITTRCTQEGLQFEIEPTLLSGDYSKLKARVMHGEVTDVVVCGGDGTVSQVAGQLYGTSVNIGILPVGSGNGLAFAAGIPGNLSKALDIIMRGQARDTDGFLVNDHFSCMLCGMGFDASVAHDFASQKKRGLVTYLKLTMSNYLRARTWPFVISDGKSTVETHAYFISIANSNQFGNNVRIAPRASLSDGLLDIIVVHKMSKARMAVMIARQIFFGKISRLDDSRFHKDCIHYFQTEKLTIENPGLAPFHADGEPMVSELTYRVSVIKNAFRLIQP